MRRFWSKSQTAQFIVLMLLALAASQAVGALIAWNDRSTLLRSAIKSEFLSRSASVAQLLESTPEGVQVDILRASGTNYSRFWVTRQSPDDATTWRREAFEQLTQPLPSFVSLGSPEKLAPAPASDALVAAAKSSTKVDWSDLSATAWPLSRPAKFVHIDDAYGMGLAVRLKDGSWLNNAFAKPAATAFWTTQSVATVSVTALLLCGIATFIARGITRPMRGMAAAAEAVGRGEQTALPEKGPDEIRRTAEAFNQMQERLKRFVEDRTRMLAAIGHDLRTPITSLRLRAEFVQDDETREKMLTTIDELRAMVEASIAFAREDAVAEEIRNVDLTALVESLCDDLAELGRSVVFTGGPRISHRCRADALRRAVRNVVENAVRYGESALVQVVKGPRTIEIIVDDRGPGIPDEEKENVFAPFFRLEQSRNQETGGVGLGLAIARTIVRRHGGDIRFERREGWFRTSISLPKAPAEFAAIA